MRRILQYLVGNKTPAASHDVTDKTEETKGLLAPEENSSDSSDPRDTAIVRVTELPDENEPREEVVPTIAKRPKPLYFITPDGRRSKRLPYDLVMAIMKFLCGENIAFLMVAMSLRSQPYPLDILRDCAALVRSRLAHDDAFPAYFNPLLQKERLQSLRDANHAHQFIDFLKEQYLTSGRSDSSSGNFVLRFKYHTFFLNRTIQAPIDLTKNYADYKEVSEYHLWSFRMLIRGWSASVFLLIINIIMMWYNQHLSKEILFSTDPDCLQNLEEMTSVSCSQIRPNTTVPIGCNNTAAFCSAHFFVNFFANLDWKPYLDHSRPDLFCYECGDFDVRNGLNVFIVVNFMTAISLILSTVYFRNNICFPSIPNDMRQPLSGFTRFFRAEEPPMLVVESTDSGIRSVSIGVETQPPSAAAAADQLPTEAAALA